jgi:hypothetical protein
MTGPYQSLTLPDLQCFPLGVVPKKDSNLVPYNGPHILTDPLSRTTSSVKMISSLHYPTFDLALNNSGQAWLEGLYRQG